MNMWKMQISAIESQAATRMYLLSIPNAGRRSQAAIGIENKDRVLNALRAEGPMTTVIMAKITGISENGARNHLNDLAKKGKIEVLSTFPKTWRAI